MPTDEAAAARRPLLFVAGWTSVVEGWKPLLRAWVEQRPIHYIETREKKKTEPPEGHRERKTDFGIEQHVADLAAISTLLVEDIETCDWYASSLGSTALIEGFKNGTIRGRSAFLLAPNAAFKFPTWGVPLTYLPWWFYPPVIRIIILPYLKIKLKERGQYIRYSRTLRAAHMSRLKKCTLMARGYSMWGGLEAVDVPCAIVIAESDSLHGHGDALRIAKELPRGEVIEVESNQWAHESAVIGLAESWQDSV
jgi:pimeloyl-ACP methyl ester carboxylesterase